MAEIFLKLLAFDQTFCAHIEYKRTMGRAEHAFDFVDSNVAVLSSFPDSQGYLEVDWNFSNWISHRVPPRHRHSRSIQT